MVIGIIIIIITILIYQSAIYKMMHFFYCCLSIWDSKKQAVIEVEMMEWETSQVYIYKVYYQAQVTQCALQEQKKKIK